MDRRPHAQDLRPTAQRARPSAARRSMARTAICQTASALGGGYCDGPADAGETVANVNVAMFGATGVEGDGGVRILDGRALS